MSLASVKEEDRYININGEERINETEAPQKPKKAKEKIKRI